MKPSPDLYVNLGLPSNTLWAKTNLDMTQANGFAVSEFQYACSFVSWGNVEMHNPVSDTEFEYDWGTINAQEPWYDGQPYGLTPGCDIQTNIGLSFDVARVIALAPWRMPTADDFVELIANTEAIDESGQPLDPSIADKRVTVNGIVGIYLKSKINGERIFFPCSGYASNALWQTRANSGHYWSSTRENQRNAYQLTFDNIRVSDRSSVPRFNGFPVRPVWKDVR